MSSKSSIGRRRFLALGGGVGVAALVAACSGGAPPTQAPAGSGSPPTGAGSAAAPTQAAAVKPAASGAATSAPAPPSGAAPTPAKPTGPKSYVLNQVPAQLSEAPMLADLVKQGKLPPLKERLPVEPCVVDRKGKYGGILKTASNDNLLLTWSPTKYAGAIQGTPLRLGPDLQSYSPNVLRGIEFSKDFKVLNMFMRKGIRWSDGHPHTADDWKFWYEDHLNNKDITPAPDPGFTVGGKMMGFTKIDDYSFRFEFAAPNPGFPLVYLAHVFGFSDDNALPAHYLKQFHIKYNDKANEQAKAEKFESWYQWYLSKRDPNQNPEVPRLAAYVVDKVTQQAIFLKRNPYYWMVDAEGKQLPYLDGIQVDRISDLAVIEAKAVSGAFDFTSVGLFVKNFKTYKDGEAKANYKTYTWKSGKNEQIYNFNFNYPDQALQKVFRDVRFRRAMSMAINRDEINEVLYFGLATPTQLTAHRTSRAYKQQYADAYAKYDPDAANKLLDEMGLKWDAQKKLRLLPDGRPFQISFDTNGPNPIHDMVFDYWRKVGVQVDYKPVLRSVLKPNVLANKYPMSAWGGDEIMDTLIMRRPKWFAPRADGDESTWAPVWGHWYATKGKEGEEPPPEIKQLYDWIDQYALTDDVQYVDKLLASQAENVWTIGTVVDGPVPLLFNKNLKNVPESDYWVWDALDGNESYPEAWYFDQ